MPPLFSEGRYSGLVRTLPIFSTGTPGRMELQRDFELESAIAALATPAETPAPAAALPFIPPP